MNWQSGYQIRVMEGPDQGALVSLSQTRLMIGRARNQGSTAEGWVLVFDKAVSRQHAELNWSEADGTYRLRHLSQTNYTWLDEIPVEGEVLLTVGQVVKVGGTRLAFEPLDVDALNAISADQSAPPLALEGELTERLNVGQLSALNLRNRSFALQIAQGPDAPSVVDLAGFYVALGRGNRTAAEITGDKNALPFDQLLELTDPHCYPNHLILKWDELAEGFRAWKNPDASAIALVREADGILWQGNLPDSGGLLRNGDRVRLGSNLAQLVELQTVTSKEAIRPVPLRASQFSEQETP